MKYLIILLLTTGAIGLWQHQEQTRTDMVYAVCNQSRISPDISEAECGRLQDKWHREFLCQANNMDPKNICWVEVK